MTTGIITRKAIAKSLKELMETKSFDKISVSDIMNHCQMRRQSFYYHFQDKYELLGWIYQQETKENSIDFINYSDFDEIFSHLIHYFYQNQSFYRKALAVKEQNSFSDYLHKCMKALYLSLIKDLEEGTLSNEHRKFLASHYSHGFVGLIKDWLEKGCQTEPEALSQLFEQILHQQLQKSIHQLLER